MAVALGAGLLFLVEPMEAKALLPELGGSPAVWTVSLVFYQTVLLAGYAYALVLTRRPRRQAAMVHAGALMAAALALPWRGPTPIAHAALAPSAWLLATLSRSVGLPLLVLAATGPLLQVWAAGLAAAPAPYGLYAVGNAASLVALLAYPSLVEPHLPLTGGANDAGGPTQHGLWSAAVLVFASLMLACAAQNALRPVGSSSARAPEPRPSLRRCAEWAGLAALPAAAMVSTTQALATDIASVPLLWVASLALYLVSFVVAFAAPGRLPLRVASWATIVLVLAIAATQWTASRPNPIVALPLYLATLLAIGILCHARLASQRPAASSIAAFNFWIAAGGGAGSVACGLVAPLVFRTVVEYPLILVLACVVAAGAASGSGGAPPRGRRRVAALAWPALVAASFVAIAARDARATHDILTTRTFFGVLRVRDAWGPAFIPRGGPHAGQETRLPLRELFHGTTLHGAQITRPSQMRLPTTYYHPSGPIGHVFAALRADPGRAPLLAHVGVVGLGVGSIAAYAKAGERFEFFEIDPAIVRIARDPRLFTFLADCEGRTDVVVADGRIALASELDSAFGLLIVDAFSSDAVPVHLLTREAVALALRKLQPNGLVAYHLSSNFFDLAPVVAEAAASVDHEGVYWDDENLSPLDVVTAKQPSRWAVIGAEPGALAPLRRADGWVPLETMRRADGDRWLWTDRQSSPLAALRVGGPVVVRASDDR